MPPGFPPITSAPSARVASPNLDARRTSPPNNNSEKSSRNNNIGSIIGGAVGGLALICICAVITVYIIRRGATAPKEISDATLRDNRTPNKYSGSSDEAVVKGFRSKYVSSGHGPSRLRAADQRATSVGPPSCPRFRSRDSARFGQAGAEIPVIVVVDCLLEIHPAVPLGGMAGLHIDQVPASLHQYVPVRALCGYARLSNWDMEGRFVVNNVLSVVARGILGGV
jgi:hypothetical protein